MSTHESLLRRPALNASAAETAFQDVQLLERAAKEWRWLAWLWVVGAVLLSVPLAAHFLLEAITLLNAQGEGNERPMVRAMVSLVVLLGFFGGVSGLYFALARQIRRGRRWAVGLALFIAALAAAATAARILWRIAHEQAVLSATVMDTVILLGHLNLLRVLFRSYAATLRIRVLAGAAAEAEEGF